MNWLGPLSADLAATAADGTTWLSIGQALLFALVAVLVGMLIARRVGLLSAQGPVGDTLAVGLASGLVVIAALWAAITSRGQSTFTPAAVGFLLAIVLAARTSEPFARGGRSSLGADSRVVGVARTMWSMYRRMLVPVLAGALFIVAIALLFGAGMAPSIRDGVQPIPFRDPPFYAILARNLATTGTESIIAPSGFMNAPGIPTQFWYHWGELWLAAAAMSVFGATPMAARYFIVLPVLLLSASGVGAAFVRQVTNPSSGRTFLFGFAACLLLAPAPFIVDALIGPLPLVADIIPMALLYAVNTYGLALVAALLLMYATTVLDRTGASWVVAAFIGSAVAFVLAAHLVIAVLGLAGLGAVWALEIGRSLLAKRTLPTVRPAWRRSLVVAGPMLVLTVAWGMLTDHGAAIGSGPPSVGPFAADWRIAIAAILLGAGVFVAIPIAWLAVRKTAPDRARLYLGVMALVAAGAIAWGLRFADFNMFYFFYAGISVFAVPVAAVAVWDVWEHLRAAGRWRLAFALVALCAAQLEVNLVVGIDHVEALGSRSGEGPIPVTVMAAISDLPAGSKIAYSCLPLDEATYDTPNLLGITAYTGRAVVPMCFEADVFGVLLGGAVAANRPNADTWAPQRALYPTSTASPSRSQIESFLGDHGIEYIYADPRHPNKLVTNASPLAASGGYELLKVP